jgi:hypothetical protein
MREIHQRNLSHSLIKKRNSRCLNAFDPPGLAVHENIHEVGVMVLLTSA